MSVNKIEETTWKTGYTAFVQWTKYFFVLRNN